MPNIRPYSPDLPNVQPTERAIDANLQTARRIGAMTSEVAEAQRGAGERLARTLGQGIAAVGEAGTDFVTRRQISQGAAAYAGLFAKKTQEWNDTVKTADPNDPTVAAKFREGLEQDFEKLKGSFQTEAGQKWAEAHTQQLRMHMVEKTASDMASLAKDAVAVNHRQTVNDLSNTVHGDPTSMDVALKLLESKTDAVIASNPNLTGVNASTARNELLQKGKETIIKSAAMGYIEKTAQMPPWASDPKYSKYIDGTELKQFESYAKAQQRTRELTEKQLRLYDKQIAEHNSHAALSKNWTDSVSFDDNGRATIKPEFYKNILDIEKQYPGAATARSSAMINWGQAQQKEKREIVVTDRGVQTKLYDGLFNPDSPTTDVDILRAANEGKLDAHTTTTLLQLSKALEDAPLKGPVYQGTMQAVKGIYGDGEKGHEAYAKFLQTFLPELIKQKRAGTLPADALDVGNPNSMISKAMAPFRLTPAQKMLDVTLKRYGMGGDMTQVVPGAAPTLPAPALPPRKDLEVGKTYQTSQGPMEWNGTGFIKPGTAK